MRDGAQSSTTEVTATTEGEARPGLDDLVREVGEHRRLDGRTVRTIWSLGGFVIGAVLWQAIGVWSLLGEAVFEPPKPMVHVVEAPVEHWFHTNCTALALDRLSGRTRSIPCAAPMQRLEEASDASRANLTVADARPVAARGN